MAVFFLYLTLDFPGGSDSKASAYNAGNPGSIPESERSGEGNGNPLQYSCLENPMHGGAWQGSWGHKESDTTEQLHSLSLCTGLCPNFLFLQGHQSYWIRAHPNDLVLTRLPL